MAASGHQYTLSVFLPESRTPALGAALTGAEAAHLLGLSPDSALARTLRSGSGGSGVLRMLLQAASGASGHGAVTRDTQTEMAHTVYDPRRLGLISLFLVVSPPQFTLYII